MVLSRRAALLLPWWPGIARSATAPPPIPDWVGRTAKLSTEGGSAWLLLQRDGTGLLSVEVAFLCRQAEVLSWQAAPDGLSLRYSRRAVLDPGRTIEGEARIGADGVLWTEGQTSRQARFEGFAPAEAARGCG